VYSVISSRLLTTVHSLQASLEAVRSYRPDFTPRMGFTWPIIDPDPSDAQDDGTRKGRASTEPMDAVPESAHGGRDASVSIDSSSVLRSSKKATIMQPLLLAAGTTAVHSNSTFAPRLREEMLTPQTEAPVTDQGSGAQKMSAQLSESPVSAAASKPSSTGVPGTKAPPGGGKKKKKRTGLLSS